MAVVLILTGFGYLIKSFVANQNTDHQTNRIEKKEHSEIYPGLTNVKYQPSPFEIVKPWYMRLNFAIFTNY